MTNKLKCPVCQQELKHEKTTGIYCCSKTFIHCPLGLGTGAFGTKELWQALNKLHQATLTNAHTALEFQKDLETARQALDVAKKALRELKDVIACPPDISYEVGVSMYADGALQEITALEHKDEK